MAHVRIQEVASYRLDEIYRYMRERWGIEQADRYITDMFQAFSRIETHEVVSRPLPAEFGVGGFFFRFERHVVYWRRLSNCKHPAFGTTLPAEGVRAVMNEEQALMH